MSFHGHLADVGALPNVRFARRYHGPWSFCAKQWGPHLATYETHRRSAQRGISKIAVVLLNVRPTWRKCAGRPHAGDIGLGTERQWIPRRTTKRSGARTNSSRAWRSSFPSSGRMPRVLVRVRLA